MKEILLAGVIALIFSFFGTPALIKLLARHGYGQMIRDDGPQSHHSKRGTPTMGGIAIILSTIVGYVAAHLILGITFSASAILVIALFTGLGLVGFIDDYLKVIKARSLGLNSMQKIIGQVLVAGLFGYFGTKFPDNDGLTPISLNLSFLRDTSIKLGLVALIIWVIFMVTATSNGVNLTDGLDGLATGASVMSFLAFVLIGVWQFGQSCSVEAVTNCYEVRDPMDLAVLAAALAASCTGFLWWNTSPAKIFMGDTGSMFIGFILSALVIEIMASDYPTYIKTIQPSNVPHLLIGMLYIPVFDSIRIFIARASEGKSPFAPDRTHIHHLLMDYHGWNHRKTSATIVVINIGICLLVWQTAVHAPQWAVVSVLLGLGIGLSLYLRNLRRVIEVRKVVKAKKEVKS